MRVLLMNWARIEDGASHGGGVNGYCLGIARGLTRAGHRVLSIASGNRYDPAQPGCRLETRPAFEGIECREIINSPVIAPSMAQFKEPLGEIASPELERCFDQALAQLRPDVLHVHNIEGYSIGCVLAALNRGIRVVYSLHNYHTLCPQVYFMQGHRRPCFSFDNGHACATCIQPVDSAVERARRDPRTGRSEPPSPLPPPPPAPPPPWETIDRPAWQPLLNVIEPEPASSRIPNEYASRRQAMVALLNRCDQVLAVSDFVRRKFESMGVSPGVLRTLRIGTAMVEWAASTPSTPAPQPCLRLAFVGYHNWFKGLPMLLDSLELLTPEYLSRIHLTVMALNLRMVEPHLRRLEPRLAGLRTAPEYQPDDLPAALAGIDLGVVPSVWWDNAPQTVMEFQACGVPVLAAELGGIPEFVRHGVDGLLFRGNDRWALARQIAEVIRQPELVVALRGGVRPPKTIAEHVVELEQVYGVRVS